jgi:hypothetical protein
VCLDCGYRGKTLRRHISTRHGLSRDEYRNRWGLRSDHPLTAAPAYSERRSTLAKARGLGRKSTAQASLEVADVDLGSEAKPARRRRVLSRAIRCVIGKLMGSRGLATLMNDPIFGHDQGATLNGRPIDGVLANHGQHAVLTGTSSVRSFCYAAWIWNGQAGPVRI